MTRQLGQQPLPVVPSSAAQSDGVPAGIRLTLRTLAQIHAELDRPGTVDAGHPSGTRVRAPSNTQPARTAAA